MPWYAYLAATLGAGIVLGFWGWVAVKIIRLQHDVVLLGAKLHALEKATAVEQRNRDTLCDDRSMWLRGIDEKMDAALQGIATINGQMKGAG